MFFESIMLPNQAIIPLGIALTHIALCLYLLLRGQLDNILGRLFVTYLLLTVFWNINLVVIVADVPPPWGGIGWAQLIPYGLIILGLAYWSFGQAFLLRSWKAVWGWLLGLIGLALTISLEQGWLDLLPPVLTWSNGSIDNQSATFVLGAAWWGLFMALTLLTTVIQYFRIQSPAHRNRIQYFFIATTLVAGGYGLYLSSVELLWTTGLIVTWFGATLLTYIVAVEELIDLGTGIRHTLRVLVVTVVTVAVYITGIYVVQIFLGDFLASTFLGRLFDPTLLVAAVTAVLLTIVYTPIRQISQRFTNYILFGQHYDYHEVIQNYSQAISHILDLNELATVALSEINRALKITKGVLLIVDSESTEQFHLRIFPTETFNKLPDSIELHKNTAILHRLVGERQALSQYTVDLSPQFKAIPEKDRQILKELDFEWFTPILKKNQLIGIFALGPKKSGQPYLSRDLQLLTTLADQIALALENATLFDRVQRNLAEITSMKNLMDNIFASIDNGVITVDVEGKITLVNQAAESILGLTSEGCLGRPYIEALPALPTTLLSNLMRNVMQRGEHYTNYDVSVDLPDRGRVNLSLNLTPLRNGKETAQGVTVVVDDLTETKRLRAVRDIFRRYVSPAVVDRLPANPEDLELGGQRQNVTILFADIRGFTTFSEKMAPEALVDTLNQYLSMAAASILMFEGTLDKFMGDAVMGIFNAPLKQEDHVLRAVRAALTMQRALADYHQGLNQERHLSFGVGLHVGEVVVGNVGMSDRMDYTAIGDAVNLAKRIQENAAGGQILISEAVYHEVKETVRADFYKKMQVKGREQPVITYELNLD